MGKIENAMNPPCEEGYSQVVTGPFCTGKCKENYYASPPVLQCRGENFYPQRSFECIGGGLGASVCEVAVGSTIGVWLVVVGLGYVLWKCRGWVAPEVDVRVFHEEVVMETVKVN